jgi:hypothetical protein
LKKDIEFNIPIIDTEIDSMIKNKEKSSQNIEKMLDTLLDYLSLGVGEDQFIKLNSYYRSICPEYSAEYNGFYQEIIEKQVLRVLSRNY